MGGRNRFILSNRMWPVAIAAGYFVCAELALDLTQTSDGIAFVWPASGVLLAGLLLSPVPNRVAILLLVGLASVIANMRAGTDLSVAAGFTIANLAEGLLAARITSGRTGTGFARPLSIVRFVSGAAAGGLLSAAIALAAAMPAEPVTFFLSWLVTVTLGMLTVTPAIVAFLRSQLAPASRSEQRWLVGITVHAAALAVAVVSFGQSDYPLMVLPSSMVIFATYFMGFSGAVGSVLISTTVAVLFTAAGYGPIAVVADPQERVIFFQLYILTLLATAMPLAALLDKSRVDAKRLKESNILLETAERTAHVGHWRYDLDDDTVYWSDEAFRIHALPVGTTMTREAVIALYHPDDRAAIAEAFKAAIKSGERFHFEARIVAPNGLVRQVESRGQAEVVDGRAAALFGVVHDVTERNETHAALAKARLLAEKRAKEATHLAETDQLTGVANRRKILAHLTSEMARSERTGEPLAVVLLDVDHFKQINDGFGHATGDMVLQRIAAVANGCLRGDDMFGRIGGEEFLIVLRGAEGLRATAVGERVRTCVRALRMAELDGEKVSVSLGVAVHQAGSDQTWLLQAADAALYQSKRDGRNRLTLAA